jgi:hypothetical protein
MSDLRDQLAENLDEAEWEWLIPHAKRDAVLVVDTQLDLLDVGVAIANDNTASVEDWINRQLLTKPSLVKLGEWNNDRSKWFKTLIIQPYVLIQEKNAAAAAFSC